MTESEARQLLFEFLNRADDGVEVRPVAGLEFGMEQLSICLNFESAAARRNERKGFNALSEFENFGRQTDGLRRVVSNDAVFDRDFGFQRACSFRRDGTKSVRTGQGARAIGGRRPPLQKNA